MSEKGASEKLKQIIENGEASEALRKDGFIILLNRLLADPRELLTSICNSPCVDETLSGAAHQVIDIMCCIALFYGEELPEIREKILDLLYSYDCMTPAEIWRYKYEKALLPLEQTKAENDSLKAKDKTSSEKIRQLTAALEKLQERKSGVTTFFNKPAETKPNESHLAPKDGTTDDRQLT